MLTTHSYESGAVAVLGQLYVVAPMFRAAWRANYWFYSRAWFDVSGHMPILTVKQPRRRRVMMVLQHVCSVQPIAALQRAWRSKVLARRLAVACCWAWDKAEGVSLKDVPLCLLHKFMSK